MMLGTPYDTEYWVMLLLVMSYHHASTTDLWPGASIIRGRIEKYSLE